MLNHSRRLLAVNCAFVFDVNFLSLVSPRLATFLNILTHDLHLLQIDFHLVNHVPLFFFYLDNRVIFCWSISLGPFVSYDHRGNFLFRIMSTWLCLLILFFSNVCPLSYWCVFRSHSCHLLVLAVRFLSILETLSSYLFILLWIQFPTLCFGLFLFVSCS